LVKDDGWESSYAVRGEIQPEVLGTVVQAAAQFEEQGCRLCVD
jgi:hypothetical protein